MHSILTQNIVRVCLATQLMTGSDHRFFSIVLPSSVTFCKTTWERRWAQEGGALTYRVFGPVPWAATLWAEGNDHSSPKTRRIPASRSHIRQTSASSYPSAKDILTGKNIRYQIYCWLSGSIGSSNGLRTSRFPRPFPAQDASQRFTPSMFYEEHLSDCDCARRRCCRP